MPELIQFMPRPLKPPFNANELDIGAVPAKEAAVNSASTRTDPTGGDADLLDSGATRSKLTKKVLQFPQNVQTGRPTPSHYIIFDRIKLSPGKGSEGDKSITLQDKKKTSVAQIALYMPASVNVGYKSQYADTAVGAGAELGASIATSIKNVATSKEGLIAAATEQVPRITTALGKAGGDMANQLSLIHI